MTKKRAIILSSIFGFITLAMLAAMIGIFALPQQNMGGDFFVFYDKPLNVDAQVSAWYQLGSNDKVNMKTEDGEDIISWTSGSSYVNDINALVTDSLITMTASNRVVVLCFKFSNTGSSAITVNLQSVPTAVGGVSITPRYKLNDASYSGTRQSFTVATGATSYYYVELTASSLNTSAVLNGSFNWSITK